MRFKKTPQLPGAGRTRAWHSHGSHTPTSPRAISLNPNSVNRARAKRGRQGKAKPNKLVSIALAKLNFLDLDH